MINGLQIRAKDLTTRITKSNIKAKQNNNLKVLPFA